MDNFDEIIAGASRYGRAGASIVGEEAKRIIARLRAELETMREREAHFAKVLGVCDGGRYRNDWETAIRGLISERDEAKALLRESRRAHYECEDGKAPNFFGNGTECECGADQCIDAHLEKPC